MITSLLLLPENHLTLLVAALRSGRLCAPYSSSEFERVVGCTVASDAIRILEELRQKGLTELPLAAALELVIHDRQHRPRLEDAIDLVMSGPEAAGVANRDTRVVVRELFANAEKSVLVAGYAVHQGQSVFLALADRMAEVPSLSVRIVLDIRREHGDASPASLLVRRFAERFRAKQWPPERPLPAVYYDPRSLDMSPNERTAMHAKCIVVDNQQVFVSSANFTEAAQVRNLEIGLLVGSPALANSVTRHFDLLIDRRLLAPVC